MDDALFQLATNIELKVLHCFDLLLALLFHEGLLHLSFLLLAHPHHDFLYARVHLLLVVLLARPLSVHPGVLPEVRERDPFFGVCGQHALDEV